jgi:hypothetical protein
MKKITFLIVLSFAIAAMTFGQDNDFYSSDSTNKSNKNEEHKHNIFIGGNFSLGFGNITFVDVSPLALYRIKERFTVGPGFSYVYNNFKDYKISYSSYGIRALGLFSPFKDNGGSSVINLGDIVIGSEYNFTNTILIDQQLKQAKGRVWVDDLSFGGGLFQTYENRSAIYFLLLYNINQTPYSNPQFEFGFLFGI